jgi:translation elongation factor EF-G
MEPILLATIEVSEEQKANVFSFLARKLARVVSNIPQGASVVIEVILFRGFAFCFVHPVVFFEGAFAGSGVFGL